MVIIYVLLQVFIGHEILCSVDASLVDTYESFNYKYNSNPFSDGAALDQDVAIEKHRIGLIQWIEGSSPNFSEKDILDSCTKIFEIAGQTLSENENYEGKYSQILSSEILGHIVTKFIDLHLIGSATRMLMMFLCLEELLDVGDLLENIPLQNYAIFPKTFGPTNSKIDDLQMLNNIEILSGFIANQQSQSDQFFLFCKRIVPSIELQGTKWDALFELIRYNLSCLLYYEGKLDEAKQIMEKLIFSERKFSQDTQKTFEKRNLQPRNKSTDASSSLVILTVASDKNAELGNLMNSVHDANRNIAPSSKVHFEVLGLGQSFPGTFVKVQTLLTKLTSLPDDQLVLFLDAYDTLIFPSIHNLQNLYFHGGMTSGVFKEIVFSVERNKAPYPDPAIGLIYEFMQHHKNENHLYLNSGTFMGTAQALLKMVTEVSGYPSILGSDQRGYTRYYLNNKDIVGLDVDGRAFLSLYGVPESSYIDVSSGLLKNDIHNTMEETEKIQLRPSVIHGNGGRRGGKEYYRNINRVLECRRRVNWSSHFDQDQHWIEIKSPLFILAGLAEDKKINVGHVLDAFRYNVITNERDIDATMYLASKLFLMENYDDATKYFRFACSIDEKVTEEIHRLLLSTVTNTTNTKICS